MPTLWGLPCPDQQQESLLLQGTDDLLGYDWMERCYTEAHPRTRMVLWPGYSPKTPIKTKMSNKMTRGDNTGIYLKKI